ncbi:hypothetical protein ACFO25_03960 [Paenactinomyces guangxiensis]|uniref:Uncharacterized protein n=1 Tax=Paenactinomyces guangxiensis TaxID=1490290 RepID=A0A7W1WRV4_9BACL|nr:hypothetical protein [Paenactinomyces guangxiensis]MBA4494922.1 hypothetical protein [Paenactinomyces guangxiensis]MBH8592005.1 hypothetical protein [Paenactinomyces guangxiensis]
MRGLTSKKVVSILFILNCLGAIIMLGSSIIVLFGDYIFNERVAETSKPYVPFFWVALLFTVATLYYSFPKQMNTHTRLSGWIFTILGLLCIGAAVHDWANGFANGDDPLIVLFIPGFIFTFTGLLCVIFKNTLFKQKG